MKPEDCALIRDLPGGVAVNCNTITLRFDQLSHALDAARAEGLLEAVEALRPFAEVSKKAKGKDDACWCGQDGAVIRYADLRRAEALLRAIQGGENADGRE